MIKDKEVADIIAAEEYRQKHTLRMVASTSEVSGDVLDELFKKKKKIVASSLFKLSQNQHTTREIHSKLEKVLHKSFKLTMASVSSFAVCLFNNVALLVS